MTRQEVISQNTKLRKRYEKGFRPLVKRVLKNLYSKYTSSLKENGAVAVMNDVNPVIDPGLTTVVQEMYKQVGLARATLTYRSLQRLPKVEKKRGSLGFNAQWTSDILNYFRLNLFNKVVLPIAETTKEYIRTVLEKGIAEGWTIDEMVKEIIRGDYLDGRVERILRTEINRAINYGNELAARTYEFQTQKRWISVHDDRTRHPHSLADGQTVDIESSFSVGGELMDFPGDPNASAENTVNCRCVTQIIAVRSRAGRLIPKENQPVRIRGRLRSAIQEIISDLN